MEVRVKGEDKIVNPPEYVEEKLPEHFKDMTEHEEKQFCFEVISRAQHIPSFYEKMKELFVEFPSPYTNNGAVRVLKQEYKDCNC